MKSLISDWGEAANPYRPLMVGYVSAVGVIAYLLFVVVNVLRGIHVMVLVDAVGAMVLVVNYLWFARHGDVTRAAVIGTTTVVIVMLMGAHFVGSQVLALLAPASLVAFFLLGKRRGAAFVGATLVAVLLWMALFDPQDVDGRPPLDIVISIALVAVLGYVYESLRSRDALVLRQLSRIDPLTGVLNRRASEERMTEELARCDRYRRPLSVILFDIDHFKRVNDLHGHATGDAVIVEVAARVRDSIRTTDALVRWGGEEFLVVLPETDAAGAKLTAERIVRVVREAPLAGLDVTVSAGVATLRRGDDRAILVARADECLYAAKRGGRDRIVCEPKAEPTENLRLVEPLAAVP